MIRPFLKSGLRLGLLAGTVSLMAGCALVSTPDPVQLYRFGATLEAPAAGGDTPAPILVSVRRVEFPDAARNERLLGVTGNEAAYIGGARWVSSAENLFDDSLHATFAARPDRVRVLDRREPGTPPLVLRVAVSSFEARYLDGQGAAPTVVITARAQLRDTPERDRRADAPIQPERGRTIERVFSISQPATENRVSAIVDAFDRATRDINTQIVDWTLTATPPATASAAPLAR